jgi:hypothetical protein
VITKRFQIGDYVVVKKVMMREKVGNQVKWRQALPFILTPRRIGQIVGITTRYDGFVEYEGLGEDGGFYYFSPTKAHCFWLVRFGLSNKEVCVADEDLYYAGDNARHPLPYSYPLRKMDSLTKQVLREDSKRWPRDTKGRWTKGPCIH